MLALRKGTALGLADCRLEISVRPSLAGDVHRVPAPPLETPLSAPADFFFVWRPQMLKEGRVWYRTALPNQLLTCCERRRSGPLPSRRPSGAGSEGLTVICWSGGSVSLKEELGGAYTDLWEAGICKLCTALAELPTILQGCPPASWAMTRRSLLALSRSLTWNKESWPWIFSWQKWYFYSFTNLLQPSHLSLCDQEGGFWPFVTSNWNNSNNNNNRVYS